MKHEIRLVVFDLDGTLADTLPDIAASVQVFLRKYGEFDVTRRIIEERIGHGAPVLLRKVMEYFGIEPADFDADLAEYKKIYGANQCENTVIYKNTRATLETLRQRGIRLAIGTMKPHCATATVLEKLGIGEFFELVFSQEDMKEPKPSGWVVRECAARCGCAPEQAMMVGDSLPDIGAGKDAGAVTVGVLGGYCDPKVLRDSGADYVVEDISSILELMQ